MRLLLICPPPPPTYVSMEYKAAADQGSMQPHRGPSRTCSCQAMNESCSCRSKSGRQRTESGGCDSVCTASDHRQTSRTARSPPTKDVLDHQSIRDASAFPAHSLQGELAEKQLRYEMDRLNSSRLIDVSSGANVRPDILKDLFKITVPDVCKVCDRLRKAMRIYSQECWAD